MQAYHARNRYLPFLIALLALLIWGANVIAVPPHPELQEDIRSGKQAVPYFLANLDALHKKGICVPGFVHNHHGGTLSKIAPPNTPTITGEFKALAILVEFTDQASQVAATFFDSLLFDSVGNTVHDYYSEVSFGQLDMLTINLPSSLGWRTAPQTYAYYVNGQNGTGAYPQNTQKLCEDLVDQVDSLVDFAEYDNDNDGYVDVLIIAHSGTGAEFSGDNDDIWSHMWGISPRLKDGVYISSFTMQPEFWTTPGDMTIGVYAHELGHGFGLPDLYDIDGSSRGVGKWDIMGYGSWLGPSGRGGSPAHMSAWTRIACGFATATNITDNTYTQAITQVETSGEIYRLWTSGALEDEYFLVENRQKTGYDAYLPNAGILIWHVDDAKETSNNTDNTQEWYPGQPGSLHYRVALEQADGLWELEHNDDLGDGADCFPGSTNNTSFDALSTPSSNSYEAGASFVKVDNISASAATMYADLIVSFAAAVDDDPNESLLPVSLDLGQNYPNPFNPVTHIAFTTSAASDLQLEIFNVTGQKIRSLLDAALEAGTYEFTWDGCDDNQQAVASGVYLYKLSAGDVGDVKKMVLLR